MNVLQMKDSDLVVVPSIIIVPGHNGLQNPYTFKIRNEAPDTLGDMLPLDVYFWDMNSLLVLPNASVDGDDGDDDVVELCETFIHTISI